MYLKKKKADIIDPAEGAVWLLGAEDAGVGLILIGLVIWPVSVPVWIWSELSVVRERERFRREQILEEERRRSDKYYNLTTEQKIDKLKELSEGGSNNE